MHVDFLTLAALRDDLNAISRAGTPRRPSLAQGGARVQQVVMPDELSLGLELYAGRHVGRVYLLASADAQHARLLFVPERLRRGVETATPFLLLLRKWVRGSRLVSVTQPPWERLLRLQFEGEEGSCELITEIMGRYSNLILVGPDGTVLDAVKRIGPDLNRYRVTLPNKPYQLPPVPPNQQPPDEVSVYEWERLLVSVEPDSPLHRLLVRRLLGISPTAAREVAARITGDRDASVSAVTPEEVAGAVAELLSVLNTGEWDPHVGLDEEGAVFAFTPYRPYQFDRAEAVPDVSTAMWRYFEARLETVDPYAAARGQVQRLLDDARERIERTLDQLRARRVAEEKVQALREAGELLLAYQWQIEAGDTEVTVPDYEGTERTIELDPSLSPVENAQAYFRRYEKAQRAAKQVPRRIAALKHDRTYVEQLASDLELAEDRSEIDAVQEALAEAGWVPKKRTPTAPPSGPRRFEIDGFAVYVGRNSRQNEQVTFERAVADDIWLHVRGMPGAHVIIKRAGRDVPGHVLQRAAELAAYYSPARKSGDVLVDYTEQRYVSRIRGGHPGLVTYRNEDTIWVDSRALVPEDT